MQVHAFVWLAAWFALREVHAQCNLYQFIAVGESYKITSPGYPGKYPPGTTCSWNAQTAPGAQLRLQCTIFNLPADNYCRIDRVRVSPTGRPDLGDAETYCGSGSWSLTSFADRLLMKLESSTSSPGGWFSCDISAFTTVPPTCNCGMKKQSRIVGGQETIVNEYPMMAGLIDSELKELFGGATIISPYYVISAAHAFENKNPSKTGVLVGDHNLSTGTDTQSAALLQVEKVTVHPSYDSNTYANDICLVKVVGQIKFSVDVGPACLPLLYSNMDFQGQTVTALGWGTLYFAGPMSQTLQEVNLTVIAETDCRKTYPEVTSNQTCTYGYRKDTCQADSGGPILWTNPANNRLILVGVISYGVSCGTDPSVNTRVGAYLSWIAQNTGEQYCVA